MCSYYEEGAGCVHNIMVKGVFKKTARKNSEGKTKLC